MTENENSCSMPNRNKIIHVKHKGKNECIHESKFEAQPDYLRDLQAAQLG